MTCVTTLIYCNSCYYGAHNTRLGNTDYSSRNRYLFEYCIAFILEILNIANKSTFVNSIRKGVPIITVASSNIPIIVKVGWYEAHHEIIESDIEGLEFQLQTIIN